MVVLGKVAAIFLMVLIGYIAGKLDLLPLTSSKYISSIVINIAAPCVVIYSMSKQELNPKTVAIMFIIFGVALAMYFISWMISIIFVKAMKISENERGVYKNYLIFTNNAFMGFPVAFALFGSEGLFLMVLANLLMPIFMFTLGVHNIRVEYISHDSKWSTFKQRLKDISNPPVISTLIGLIIFIFQIPIPNVIDDVLSMMGATMAPLCMIVIGIQLTESNPLTVMTNHKLIVMSAFRLIIIPFLIFLPLYLMAVEPLVICVMTLNAMLPCSAIAVALAEEYKNNVRLAAEGAFLSTLFSIATIPVIGILLTTFIL